MAIKESGTCVGRVRALSVHAEMLGVDTTNKRADQVQDVVRWIHAFHSESSSPKELADGNVVEQGGGLCAEQGGGVCCQPMAM